MELNQLFPNYFVENEEFECKARLNREDSFSWMKTVDGFVNAKGGVFFLGVEDKSLKVIGYTQQEADSEKMFFHNEIHNHMNILPSYITELVPYEVHQTTRFILKITIFETLEKPLIMKYNGMPMVFVRRDGFTNAATEEELRTMVLNSPRKAFDEAISDVDFQLDNFTRYASFYRERTGKEVRIKELEAIKFFVNGKLSNGALLFQDGYRGERTKIVCSMYRGKNRGDDTIITSNSFQGNLIDGYQFMYEFIQARMNHGWIKLEDKRIDVDSYPKRALFEAIINALAHRDYYMEGTQINVDLFANRLVISSPGSLFGSSGNLPPTYDLSSFVSKRRNEVISNAFVLAKAMEAKGTGLEKIMEEYAPYDKKHQPYIYSKNNTFFIVLPDLTNEDGISIADDSFYVIGTINHPTRFDYAVLSYCYLTARSIKEITEHLGISNSSFFKKNVVDNLLEQGYLEEEKQGNKNCYRTKSEKIKIR